MRDLYLQEELLLLALRDREGTNALNLLHMALGAGLMAELMLQDRIEVRGEKRKARVHHKPGKPLGDPILDDCLSRIANAKRLARPTVQLSRFTQMSKLKHRVAAGLCRLGVLREDEKKVLLLFTRKIYPEVNPKPERALIARLESAIFNRSAEIDVRTRALLSIAHSVRLLPLIFDKKQIKEQKKHIEALVAQDPIGSWIKTLLEEAQAAAAAAGASTVIVTTSVIV